MYCVAFLKDSLKSKVLVYGVYALEISQTVMSAMTAFHVFATGYGNFAAYGDIWIVWFSIPLMSGIGASNKPIHCSIAESPSFFQRLKRSTPIASAASPHPWLFQVWFYLYAIFFEAMHILF
jgi:hypothetical protein